MNRIVIFLGSTGHGSGAERVLEYLLVGAVDRRSEICLVSPPSSSVSSCARDLGYEWIPWHTDHDGFRQNVRALRNLIRREGATPLGDLVHSWHTRHLEWAWILGRRWQAPAAGTIHDDPSPSHDQFGRLRKWIIRSSVHHLDGVVAVSDAVSARGRSLGWNAPITTIHNGLPDDAFQAAIREENQPLRLGFMATGVKWKGVQLLPDLVRRTSDLSLEWHLFGAESPDTHAIVEPLSRHPNVHNHGRVPLENALPHFDVLLHLSTAFDPYPTVLLEAARAGIPAIASKTGGSPEIVVDEKTGLLVEPGDFTGTERAIRRLHASAALRRELGHAARLRFEENFGVERMVADYFSFWDRLRLVRS